MQKSTNHKRLKAFGIFFLSYLIYIEEELVNFTIRFMFKKNSKMPKKSLKKKYEKLSEVKL